MAGTFMLGETKIRPGSYFNIQKKGTNASASVLNGVTAVVFKSDFGPIGKVVELSPEDGYESTFGNALTTDALREAFNGGAITVLAVRLGDGGSQANVTLKGTVDGDNPVEKGWYVKDGDTYVKATDTSAVEGKTYYENSTETVYTAVSASAGDNPKDLGLYEVSDGNYVETNDTTVQNGKTYYRKDYVEDTDVEGNPAEQGLYEYDEDTKEYKVTTDTEVAEGKSYYSLEYVAAQVTAGDNPAANGWYVATEGGHERTTDTVVVPGTTYYEAKTQEVFNPVEAVVGGSVDAVSIVAKYPGNKPFSVTIRTKLADPALKECIIYTGTSIFEKVEFDSGNNEAAALVEAFSGSKKFTALALNESAVMDAASQVAFTAGENPVVTTSSYSDAFALAEEYEFNTICVDTEDTGVHLLLQSFVNRIFNAGSLAQAVVAEKHTVDLDTRMAHARAFNDEKMNYVLNAYVNEQGTELDGYQTAARIAGMIGAVYAGSSLTHTVISGFTELLERLTNTEMIAAEKNGCIVLSLNKDKQVWIDNAINTLITPADNQDDGWKKIRRVKTRFELIRRVNRTTDDLVGKVDNDSNGRATVMAQITGIGKQMISESKLTQINVYESTTYKADGDSAWFDIDVVDKDSMEHIYLVYRFQYSTNEE